MSPATDQVLVNGMVWGQVEPLTPPIDYEFFQRAIVEALGRSKEQFRPDVESAQRSMFSRGFFEFCEPHYDDPTEVKWALLLPPKTPETLKTAKALERLVAHRKGTVIHVPAQWEAWLDEYRYAVQADRPYYNLIAAEPTELPFRFQYLLDVDAAVGRISFDTPEEYAAYAEKVVDFETRKDLFVSRRAVVFAPLQTGDHGATYLSSQFMAKPLAELIGNADVSVTRLIAQDATFQGLLDTLTARPPDGDPALVYTASHGLGVRGNDPAAEATRRRLQGALVCQDYDGASGLFSADTVSKLPAGPFLHGSIVMTYACYGAGSPHWSDFFHWYHDPKLLLFCPQQDFVAALPQTLLAHPRGPLAFFGHVDPSFGHSFSDPTKVADDRGWGSRMAPFREAVGNILSGATIGYAVKRFNEVYAITSVDLANREDRLKLDPTLANSNTWRRVLVDSWLTHNDMQNFVVLGDPAVRTKMPAPTNG